MTLLFLAAIALWAPTIALPQEPDDPTRQLVRTITDASVLAPPNKAVAERLIDAGANVNALIGGHTPILMMALEREYDDVAHLLIQRGADINTLDSSNLFDSILSFSGCAPHAVDIEAISPGKSVLMYAAEHGSTDIVKLLLDKGAKVNYQNRMGWTALRAAVLHDRLEAAHLLIDRGADVNASETTYLDQSRIVSLHWAVLRGSYTMAELLLSKTAPDYRDHTLYLAASKGNHKMVQLLVAGKANASNALRAAAIFCNVAAISILVDNGGDPTGADSYGFTPIGNAVDHGNISVMNWFLDHGVSANTRTRGRSLLVEALVGGGGDASAMAMAKSLLEKGFDVNAKGGKGKTELEIAIDQAKGRGFEKCVALLEEWRATHKR